MNRGHWALVLALGAIACGGASSALPASTALTVTPPPLAHARVLSITTSPRLEPAPTQHDFVEAVDLAYNAGARGSVQTWRWSELEPSTGNFNLKQASESVAYASYRGFVIMLGIQVLNTTEKETPSDLKNIPFDSPQMKQRFHALIDALRPSLNERVLYLSIGNEVDIYLGQHPEEWDAYQNFYEDAVAYVHSIAPRIQVGVTSTFDGAKKQIAQVQKLNTKSDVFIMTYYPLEDKFIPRSPDVAKTEIPKMIELAKSKPLILQEVGYPTSSVLKSSEQKQADFIANVYATWATNNSNIPFLNFFLMHDLTSQMCNTLTRDYGLPGEVNFKEFLCSLGFRQANGRPKLGWDAFVVGASKVK